MHLNVEIKAQCSDPQRVRDLLESQGAEYKGLDHQIDTYFKVSNGRLKLGEGTIENNLVFFNGPLIFCLFIIHHFSLYSILN